MEKYSVENVLIAVLGFPCIFYLILIGLGYWAGIDVVNTAMFLYFKVFITVFLFSVAVFTVTLLSQCTMKFQCFQLQKLFFYAAICCRFFT